MPNISRRFVLGDDKHLRTIGAFFKFEILLFRKVSRAPGDYRDYFVTFYRLIHDCSFHHSNVSIYNCRSIILAFLFIIIPSFLHRRSSTFQLETFVPLFIILSIYYIYLARTFCSIQQPLLSFHTDIQQRFIQSFDALNQQINLTNHL